MCLSHSTSAALMGQPEPTEIADVLARASSQYDSYVELARLAHLAAIAGEPVDPLLVSSSSNALFVLANT